MYRSAAVINQHPSIGIRCNPFYTDIYYLGDLVRQESILVWMMPTMAYRAAQRGGKFIVD